VASFLWLLSLSGTKKVTSSQAKPDYKNLKKDRLIKHADFTRFAHYDE